jgi:hypothetical protein
LRGERPLVTLGFTLREATLSSALTVYHLRPDETRPMGRTLEMLDIIAQASKLKPLTDVPAPQICTQPMHGLDPISVGEEPFLLRVLRKRLEWAGGEYSTNAILLASSMCRNLGQTVIWAYSLYRLWREHGPVTLEMVQRDPIAGRKPTEKGYSRLWEAQKQAGAPLGNLLDDPRTWDKDEPYDIEATAVDRDSPVMEPPPEMPRNHPGYLGAFSTSQAEGAWPNGSRVRKMNSLEGDGNPDGAEGVILGSMTHPEMGYAYWIEWDSSPKVAVMVAVNGTKGPRLALAEKVH